MLDGNFDIFVHFVIKICFIQKVILNMIFKDRSVQLFTY